MRFFERIRDALRIAEDRRSWQEDVANALAVSPTLCALLDEILDGMACRHSVCVDAKLLHALEDPRVVAERETGATPTRHLKRHVTDQHPGQPESAGHVSQPTESGHCADDRAAPRDPGQSDAPCRSPEETSLGQLVPSAIPEQEELRRAWRHLARLKDRLAEIELERATLIGQLDAFKVIYLRRVGTLLAELDSVEAEIAVLEAARVPGDTEATAAAEHARRRAKETAREQAWVERQPEREPFVPSEDLRRLYRRAAKALHPDLTQDPEEHALRTEPMAKLNEAYQQGDRDRIEALLDEFQDGEPESSRVDGDVSGALERLARQIEFIQRRVSECERELSELRATHLADLHRRVEAARAREVDLLEQIRSEVIASVEGAYQRLTQARRDGASRS